MKLLLIGFLALGSISATYAGSNPVKVARSNLLMNINKILNSKDLKDCKTDGPSIRFFTNACNDWLTQNDEFLTKAEITLKKLDDSTTELLDNLSDDSSLSEHMNALLSGAHYMVMNSSMNLYEAKTKQLENKFLNGENPKKVRSIEMNLMKLQESIKSLKVKK